ncbi:Zinc finger protein 34 [Mactra antiquata]
MDEKKEASSNDKEVHSIPIDVGANGHMFNKSSRKRKLKDFSDYQTDFRINSSRSCKHSSTKDQDNVINDAHLRVKSSRSKPFEDGYVSKCKTNNSSGKRQQNVVVSSNTTDHVKDVDTCTTEVTDNHDAVRSKESEDNCNDNKTEGRFQTYGNDVPINLNIASKHSKIKIVSARVIPHIESGIHAKMSIAGPTRNISSKVKDETEVKHNINDKPKNDVGICKSKNTNDMNWNKKNGPSIETPFNKDISKKLSDGTHHKSKKKSANKNDTKTWDFSDDVNVREWFNFSNLKNVIFGCMFDQSCSFTSNSYSKWCHHIRSVHNKKKCGNLAYCLKCQYKPLEKRLLKEHILVKHNDTPTCPIGLHYCGITSETTSHLLNLVACIFCGFLMDQGNFEQMHDCKRVPFYFYCPFCDEREVDFDLMSGHMQTFHKDEVVYAKEVSSQYKNIRTSDKDLASRLSEHETECQKCDIKFNSNIELKLHVNKEHELYPFSCGVCRLCYVRLGSLRYHMKRSHLSSLICKHCQRRFGCKRDLERHKATHSNIKPFKCEHCDKSYADNNALHAHIAVKHSTVWNNRKSSINNDQPASYMCHLCGENLQTKLLFNLHQKQKHTQNEDLFTCTICSKSFTNQRSYTLHLCDIKNGASSSSSITYDYNTLLKTVSESCISKTFDSGSKVKCKICNKSLESSRSLRRHLFITHLDKNEKKFICIVCDQHFLTKSELKNHLKIHKDCRPYRCKICSKTFRQLGHVKEHLLSHASTSKYQCPLCVLIFKTQHSLLHHVARHCRVNPFECPMATCVLKFATIYLLNIHLRQCMENDPDDLKCKLCQIVCISKHEAITHLKTHENEDIYDCQICHKTFHTHTKCVRHKIELNHFTDTEKGEASKTLYNRQHYKYTPTVSTMPVEELQSMYEYVTQHDLEIREISDHSGGMNLVQENVDDHNASDNPCRTDTQNEGEIKKVVETVLKNFSTDPTKDRNSCTTNDTEIVLQQSDDFSWSEMPVDAELLTNKNFDDSENTVVVTISDEINVSEMVSQEIVSKMASKEVVSELMPQEIAVKIGQNVVVSEMSEESVSKVISQEPVVVNNCKVIYQDDITTSCLSTELTTVDNVVDITEMKLESQISNKDIEIKENECLGKTILSVVKMIHNGEEVYILNQDNSSAVIDGNSLNIILPLSSDEKYSIQNFNVNEDPVSEKHIDKLISDVSTCIEGQTESIPIEYANEKETQPETREIILETTEIPFTCMSGEVKTVQNEIPTMLAETNMNVDKVQGFLTDTEAGISNQKIDENNTNYKVRLCYYNDRSKRIDEYPLKCDVCDKRYKRRKDLNSHKKVHIPNEERKFHCTECGKGFNSKNACSKHERIHSDVKPYKCTKCDKSFRQLGHLQVHLRVHADYRPFQCAICEKTFISNSLLSAHVRNKHNLTGEQFNCDLCRSSFSSVEKLRCHKINHLSKTRKSDLLSKFCNGNPEGKGDYTPSKDDLRYHKISHLDKTLKSDLIRPQDQSQGDLVFRRKPVMCDICGKVVTSIKQHKSTHETNSIPCPHCQKVFASSFKLKSHLSRTHTTKYLCDICGLELKSYQTAVKHSKTHTGDKYNCSTCNNMFTFQHEFIKHLVTCVGDQLMTEFNKLSN